MLKKVLVIKFLTTILPLFSILILISCMSFGEAMTFRHQETWSLQPGEEVRTFPVSVFVVSKSHWRSELIQKRFEFMNEALKSCNLGVSHALYYKINGDFDTIHIDDGNSLVFDNGISKIAESAPLPTAIRMFYFDDYVEPISSAGSFPYAVTEQKGKPLRLYSNTTWQPFYTPARLQQRTLPYSEEAHELGHILLQAGHDTSSTANIMSDRSSLRINTFTPEQCSRFILPELKPRTACESVRNSVFPAFAFKYHHFSKADGYFPLECGSNTQNLIRYLNQVNSLNKADAKIIKIIHKNADSSVTPLAARGGSVNWKHHVFLLMNGLVFDLDYTSEPRIELLETYMKTMWGDNADDYLFQVRPWNEPGKHLHLDVLESFEKKEYEILNREQLASYFFQSLCL